MVLKYAPGARAVRFLRKLPLLKGLADNALVGIAERLKEEVYQDGEYLIRTGDQADGLYVIRYGSVKVQVEGKVLATLGRGQFVGERTLVTGVHSSFSGTESVLLCPWR
jgi:cGMP-dependent protein kinase